MKWIVISALALVLIAGCGGKEQKASSSPKHTDGTLPSERVEGPAIYHSSLGEIHLRYGFSEKAVAEFRTAVDKESDIERKADYQSKLGQAYLESGDPEAALCEMENAITTSNRTEHKCDLYLQLAKVSALQGREEMAEKAYRFVADHSTRDWQRQLARTELDSIHARTDKIDDVISSLEEAIKLNPGNNEARLRLAEILTSTNPNPRGAIELYEAVYREGKLSPVLTERLGSLYLRVGALSAAERIYEGLVLTGPEQKRNRYRLALAQVHEKANEPAQAEQFYKIVLKHNLSTWEKDFAKQRLHALYERTGVLDEVVAGLEKKAAENPEDAGAIEELSEIYSTLRNNRQKAIFATERLVLLKPGDSTALERLADLYEKAQQKEKGIETLRSLLPLLPESKQPACLERIARLYSEMGSANESVDWIGELVASQPTSPEIHARAAVLYFKNSRVEECLSEYERAIALSTSAEQRDTLRAKLAEQLYKVGDYARAVRIYERLAASSVSGSLRDTAKEKLAALHVIQENRK